MPVETRHIDEGHVMKTLHAMLKCPDLIQQVMGQGPKWVFFFFAFKDFNLTGKYNLIVMVTKY